MTRYRRMGQSTVRADHHWLDVLRDERLASEAIALAKAHDLGGEVERSIEHDSRPWDRKPDVITYRFAYGRVIHCDGQWAVERVVQAT
jgi:hypothetical protein